MYISKKALLVTPLVIITALAVFSLLNGQRQMVGLSGGGSGGFGSLGSSNMMYPESSGAVPAMMETRGQVANDSIAVSKSFMPSPIYPGNDAILGGEMYIQETSLSLVAKDPVATEQQIRQIATDLGGFLVTSQLSRPEEGSTATIVVRVPTNRLDEALQRFEAAGERVINKAIQGRDVTEQYQDLESKLATIATVQARLEQLLEQTNDASALLQIQQQLFQIQDQKDYLEGQRRYLEGAAELSRITVYLASDELALPYVPAQPWKPDAIFKQAVRSLVGSLRGVGTGLIWGAVYLPLALPFVIAIWWLRRSRRL